jgi:CRP/FNR family cyclic AMP-dependent transcriptional regulator
MNVVCTFTRIDRLKITSFLPIKSGIVLIAHLLIGLNINWPCLYFRGEVGTIGESGGTMKGKKSTVWNASKFMLGLSAGRVKVHYPDGSEIINQGGPCDAVFFIQSGRVKLTVVSKTGKEGIIAILQSGDFFGEGCIGGQLLHLAGAIAMGDCTLLRFERLVMMRALRKQPKFSEFFVTFLLARHIRHQEDLIDRLFVSSEKRLARVLVLLARLGKEGKPEPIIPKVTQDALAQMVGTTRSRVNQYMNRFRELGLLEYNGGLRIRPALLDVALQD